MSLLFNMLSRPVMAFLPRRKCLQMSWLQGPSTVILETKKRKSVTASTFPPSICDEMMGPDAMILDFWILSFKPTFYSPISLSSRGSLVSLCFLPLGWYHQHIWGYWYWKVVAEPWKMLGFLASGREEFNPGPGTRLDHSELLCNKVLLKYKRDREGFWHRHQKGAERVPLC